MEVKPQATKKKVLFSGQHGKHTHSKILNSIIRSNRYGKGKNLLITYNKADGSMVERKVTPIVAKNHLLLAHDHHRNAVRSFHIDRIQKMEKTAFIEGFEKRSGWLQRGVDALKGLMTGKKYLYHGTTGKASANILKEGLRPGLRSNARKAGIPGVPGHEGKLFMTSNADVARTYAALGEDGVVIKATIPKKEFDKIRMKEIPSIPKQVASFTGTEAFEAPIDPKYLKIDEKINPARRKKLMQGRSL